MLADEPDGPPTLFVKGPADQIVRDLVADAGVEIRVVDRQPFSHEDLHAPKEQVVRALQNLGYQNGVVWHDIERPARIQATVQRRGSLPDRAADISARLPDPLREAVTITVSDEPVVSKHYLAGGVIGGQMGGGGLMWPYISTGWPVIDRWVPSYQGLSTAGHTASSWKERVSTAECRETGYHHILRYDQYRAYQGRWGDVGIYESTSTDPYGRFWANVSSLRNIDAVATQFPIGQRVCFFSALRSTREGCSDILDDDVHIWEEGHIFVASQVMMSSGWSVLGDSGSPWYFNYTAFGSHTGAVAPGGTKRDIFSPAWRFTIVGVRVKTIND
jgi:hypothetical protein